MLLQRVRAYIKDENLLEPESSVLVGASGGVDSVVLLLLLDRLGFAVQAAHVNYGLRPGADKDESFMRSLCEERDIPLHVGHCDARARSEESRLSLQAAAREQRYRYFERMASELDVPHVAVGHHLDDQAETVLLNLFRGSGPEGLAGMPVRRRLREGGDVWLVRPLLCAHRKDIAQWARDQGLSWRRDPSNRSTKYRRGALRSDIIPEIEKHFGEAAMGNVARAGQLMRQYVEASWQPELLERFDDVGRDEDSGGSLRLDGLRQTPGVWQRRLLLEALRRWIPEAPQRKSVAEALAELVTSQPGRRLKLEQGTVWRERHRIAFRPDVRDEVSQPAAGSVRPGETIALQTGSITVEETDTVPADLKATPDHVAYLNARHLTYPLTVRPWEAGDRFQPLGMDHHKKISDFLTDVKVPPSERDAVLVVCAGQQIVWIVGYRISNTVRVRPDTRHLAKITFIPA